MELHLSTWEEVAAYLKGSSGIMVPVGSTEQHGPNGLIGTDSICPEIIARRAGEAAGILIGPTITLGVAQFNLGFPGTVTTRPSTFMAMIEDYVRSLARHGFSHVYFLNGHGGNVAPARAAFQEIYAETSLAAGGRNAAVRCRLRSWWDLPAVDHLRRELYGPWEGMHATPSEVAITQYAYPGSVRHLEMAPPRQVAADYMRDHAGDDHFDAEDHRRRFPDGRIGSDPSLASPEAGGRLVAAAVADAVADFQAFLEEE